MTKKKDDSKLSPIGQRAEKVISAVLKDIEADARVKDATKRRYTLTDVMKVIDRAAKFEAIRAKLSNDDEGAFFKQSPEEEPEQHEEEGAEDEHA